MEHIGEVFKILKGLGYKNEIILSLAALHDVLEDSTEFTLEETKDI
jgi:(p)ppGpp synthase/HD superfamily hydrolase